MTEKKQDKLPVSQMIGFALNGCGSSCIAGILGSFLTVYLTDNLLLSMGFITAMMTAARIINAVTEGLSGFLIDMTHTKMGKARPWILGTAFFVALPVFLIFNTPTSFGPTGRMIWVFVNYLLHVAVFGAVISIATATLLIKMTSNSVERAKVTNLGSLLGQISNLIVSAYGVPVLMYFGGYETGYFGLSLIFCSIGFILPFLTGVICRETPEVWAEAAQQLTAARKRPSLPVKTQLKYVFGCKYALPLFGMFLTYNFAGMIFGSIKAVDSQEQHQLGLQLKNSRLTLSVDGTQSLESSCVTDLHGETTFAVEIPSNSPLRGPEQRSRAWAYSAHHAWVDQDTLLLTVCWRETGHYQTWKFQFAGEKLFLWITDGVKGMFQLFGATSDRNMCFRDRAFTGETRN